MLYSFGPLSWRVFPFNTHEVGADRDADFAVKPLLGRPPAREFMGDGDKSVEFRCRLFPLAVGGLDELGLADRIREAGVPQLLIRGDGAVVGWYVLDKIREISTYLNADGIGRKVEVDIHLSRSDPPSPSAFFALLGAF